MKKKTAARRASSSAPAADPTAIPATAPPLSPEPPLTLLFSLELLFVAAGVEEGLTEVGGGVLVMFWWEWVVSQWLPQNRGPAALVVLKSLDWNRICMLKAFKAPPVVILVELVLTITPSLMTVMIVERVSNGNQ
jgi:hypothetical protein